jgi:hypothetical protein
MENRHSQSIPQDVLDKIKQHLAEAKTLLQPFVVTLTTEQRQTLPKMSDGTYAFGAKALESAIVHPEFLPSHISLDEWKIDMDDVNNLKQVAVHVDDLTQIVADIRMVAGVEAYFSGRGYYHSAQRADNDGVQGAKPVVDDLKPFFRHRGNRAKKPEA